MAEQRTRFGRQIATGKQKKLVAQRMPDLAAVVARMEKQQTEGERLQMQIRVAVDNLERWRVRENQEPFERVTRELRQHAAVLGEGPEALAEFSLVWVRVGEHSMCRYGPATVTGGWIPYHAPQAPAPAAPPEPPACVDDQGTTNQNHAFYLLSRDGSRGRYELWQCQRCGAERPKDYFQLQETNPQPRPASIAGKPWGEHSPVIGPGRNRPNDAA